jgi:hypothetical protein
MKKLMLIGVFLLAGCLAQADAQTATPAPLRIGCPGVWVGNECQLPNAQVGVPYSIAVSVFGGTPPYTFSILSGALPPGLMLTFNEVKTARFLHDLETL